MPKERPSKGNAVPFITGGDWSIGLNSRTSIGQAELLQILGRRLRTDYSPMLEEPLPDHIASLVHRLEDVEKGGRG